VIEASEKASERKPLRVGRSSPPTWAVVDILLVFVIFKGDIKIGGR
jgi:hypothetical protein